MEHAGYVDVPRGHYEVGDAAVPVEQNADIPVLEIAITDLRKLGKDLARLR